VRVVREIYKQLTNLKEAGKKWRGLHELLGLSAPSLGKRIRKGCPRRDVGESGGKTK